MREQSNIAKLVEKIVYLAYANDATHAIYPTDNLSLFYGLRKSSMAWFTCMAAFDDTKAGYIAVQQSLPRVIIKAGLVPVEDMLSLEPDEIVMKHPLLPMFHQHKEVKYAFDQYRALLGMFADNYALFSSFQQELNQDPLKKDLATYLSRDLEFLRPIIIDGANALRNPKSMDPVHDFLMIVEPKQFHEENAAPDQL